jgi:hypothetical protein
MVKIFLSLLVFFCLSQNCSAEPQSNVIKEDLEQVQSLLSKDNIDPSSISWKMVDFHCKGSSDLLNRDAFNECRYKSAINYHNFRKDHQTCIINAELKYPESLIGTSIKRSVITKLFSVVKSEGSDKTTYNVANLKSDRREFLQHCMYDLGWDDHNHWQSGRSVKPFRTAK